MAEEEVVGCSGVVVVRVEGGSRVVVVKMEMRQWVCVVGMVVSYSGRVVWRMFCGSEVG